MALKQMDLESLLVEVEDPNFVPCPRITLSLDAGKLGVCGICHESQLLLSPQKRRLDDQTVAILPCGHIAGYECLKNWFSFHQSCPFCRVPLNYQFCPHASRLIRPLTREKLLSTPDTLAVGGVIPDQCFDCSIETDANVHKYVLEVMLQQFNDLRASYHAETHERKKIALKSQLNRVKNMMDSTFDEIAAYQARALTWW